MAYVKNLNYTSDKYCKCGSWITHWEKHSKQKANMCSVYNCEDTDLVGAHVKKLDDDNDYIIPLCRKHNGVKKGEILNINVFIYLGLMVSANVAETCGK